MKPGLQLKFGQHLIMTPQLQNAIKLLQLSKLELNLEIHAAIEANPMLELIEEPIAETDNLEFIDPNNEDHHIELPIDTNWEDIFQDSNINYQTNNYPEQQNFDTINNHEITLKEHLTWQLNLTPFSETDRAIAITIIDAISENGYLTCSLEEIYEHLNPIYAIEFTEIEIVLRRLQHFDPLGVAARNLQECLSIQLNCLPKHTPFLSTAKTLVDKYLELLGQKNFTRLKNRLKLTNEELEGATKLLTKLNPRPGSVIGIKKSDFIIPDVIVVKKHGKWMIELNKDYIPKVKLNANYTAMIRRADTSRENKFLQEHLKEARWFLKSLQNRNETLLKVTTCIIEQQRDFLEHGEEAMKPLILQDIAATIGLHESTISRITNQKYLYTPRGIYELKSFFSSHVTTNDGEKCSATAIQAIIKKFITKEQSIAPLSDSKIAALLAKQGINIARRTVAKYREALAIPPSKQRKCIN